MHLFKHVSTSYQNLSDGRCPWRGRAWVSLWRNTLGLEWSLLRQAKWFLFEIITSSDDDLVIAFGLPRLFNVFLSISRLFPARLRAKLAYVPRVTGFSLDTEGFLTMCFWDSKGWVGDARWEGWQHNVFLGDLILGRAVYSEQSVDEGAVDIPMPEGWYPSTYRLYDGHWKRPRWPRPLVVRRVTFDIEDGIPIPGKGESSWDLDDDAYYSYTVNAETINDGLVCVVEDVMNWRNRYGGQNWRPVQA